MGFVHPSAGQDEEPSAHTPLLDPASRSGSFRSRSRSRSRFISNGQHSGNEEHARKFIHAKGKSHMQIVFFFQFNSMNLRARSRFLDLHI